MLDTNIHIWLTPAKSLNTVDEVKSWEEIAQRDIDRLQKIIASIKDYQSTLTERAIMLLDADLNTAYTRVLTIERDKSYCSKRVTYTVAIVRRYNDKSIKEQDELREEYPGSERHIALARFAELQKLHPGIDTEKHLEKARWER